mgnify:CR=1 FL=1
MSLAVVQDRFRVVNTERSRVAEAVEAALRQANGRALGLPVQLIPFEETDGSATTRALRDLVREQGIAGLIGGVWRKR